MTKHFYLILFVVIISSFKGEAQDTTQTSRDIQLQQALGMTNEEYSDYSRNIKDFDKRLSDIFRADSLDKDARSAAMERALRERRAYLQASLTQDQQQKLLEFNRQNAIASPAERQKRELAERLRQKGITVVTGSGN